jgi:predicted transcriptional regulator
MPERRSPRRRDQPVQTYLSSADLKRLDSIADERDASRSSVARELLHAALTAAAVAREPQGATP